MQYKASLWFSSGFFWNGSMRGLLTSLRPELCWQGLICTFQDFGALKNLDEIVFVMHVILLSRSLVEKARAYGMESSSDEELWEAESGVVWFSGTAAHITAACTDRKFIAWSSLS
jgi:hypothetical protein